MTRATPQLGNLDASDAWDAQAPDGVISRYEMMCELMRKELT